MRPFFLAMVSGMIMPLVAIAEIATVQSGEHAAFTRLVAPLRGDNWTVEQSGREVTLTYENYSDGFDIGQVFDLVPRTRIQSVTASNNELLLKLACDCVVSAITERDLYVVVDVANARKDLVSRALDAGSQDKQESAQVNSSAPEAKPNSPDSASTFLQPAFGKQAVNPLQQAEIARQFHLRLSNELNTAARRQILKSINPNSMINNGSSTEKTLSSVDTTMANPKFEGKNDNQIDLATRDPHYGNLRIRTNRDIPDTFRDLTEMVSTEGQVCPSDNSVKVSDWGDHRPFAIQMAESRNDLFGEFDRLNPEVAKMVAQTYIYFGFGLEARQILTIDPGIVDQDSILRSLANLVDDMPHSTSNVFERLSECTGDSSLWAALAAPMPPDGTLPNSDDVVRSLNKLPPHLRVLLAPRLNLILLAYGDTAGAAATLRSLDRLPGELPSAVKFAQTKTSLSREKSETAKAQLTEIIGKNSKQAPQALIDLIDAKMAAGQPISVDTVKLVEAYHSELRDTQIGPELRRTHIIALIQSGQFDQAHLALNTTLGNPKTPTDKNHSAHFLGALTKSANDIVFLEHIFRQPDIDFKSLPTNVLMELSKRFLRLGFPTFAERALPNVPDQSKNRNHMILSAQISLAMEKPFKAQAGLLGLTGEDVDLLRAKAKEMSGDLEGSNSLYSELGLKKKSNEVVWLSENWRNLVEEETSFLAPINSLAEESENEQGATGLLTRAMTMLDQSTQSRQDLSNLLAADELQVQPPIE